MTKKKTQKKQQKNNTSNKILHTEEIEEHSPIENFE